MEVAIIIQKCSSNKRLLGVRTQKMEDGDWWRTWAFAMNERQAKREGYDTTPVQGSLRETEEFPGCPYCSAHSFAQCPICHKRLCWNGESHVCCPWCSAELSNFVTATEFNLLGGDL